MNLRSHLSALTFCLTAASLGTACANNADASAPMTGGTAAPLTRATLDGSVDQALVTPRGDIRGLRLQDGTIVRLPPGALAAGAVAPGDAVQVEGDEVASPGGRTIEHAVVKKSGAVVAQASEPPAPPRPRDPSKEKALEDMKTTGSVRALVARPDGRIEALLLADGTTASLPPRADVAALGLKVGDTVTVTGRGGTYPAGKALHVDAITLADGKTTVIDTPPPVMKAVERQGTIERVLVNPHGDVDTVLLADGTTVRLAPTPPSDRLAKGQTVQIVGEGTGNFVRATRIASASGDVLTNESTPPVPPQPPKAGKDDPMQDLKTSSTIERIVRGPRGEPDALVLADGATVKLPPRLRDDAGESLKEGARVQVAGRGGSYPQGMSLRATSVQVDGGQTFTEPTPPPPPGGPGAPPPPAGGPGRGPGPRGPGR